MKKLLLLLLLPACLLGQEEKPRKLYFEIKQGVGLPSIGIKYKNQKGNYWNVGVNTIDYMPSVFNKNGYKFYRIGPYFSFTKKIEYKFTSDFGLQTVILDDGDDAYSPARNMVKSFTEEEEKKSTSFEEGGGQHHINKDEKEKECNLLEQSESFDSIVPQSPPPMTMFLRMDTFPDENADDAGDEKDHDIGLDDLGSRWNKRPQLPFGTDDDDDDDGSGS